MRQNVTKLRHDMIEGAGSVLQGARDVVILLRAVKSHLILPDSALQKLLEHLIIQVISICDDTAFGPNRFVARVQRIHKCEDFLFLQQRFPAEPGELQHDRPFRVGFHELAVDIFQNVFKDALAHDFALIIIDETIRAGKIAGFCRQHYDLDIVGIIKAFIVFFLDQCKLIAVRFDNKAVLQHRGEKRIVGVLVRFG